MTLSVSLIHKISVAMGFSSRVKAKSCKKKSHAMREACGREVSLNYAQCPEHTVLVYIQTFLTLA
jgi:hypothetical protein